MYKRQEGEDLVNLDDKEMREIRGNKIAMVFQEPMTSLNPVLTIGRQLTETLELHQDMNKEQAAERAAELLTMVGIPDARQRLDDHPHQFSGGMRQRVMIAMALSCNPKLIIADEPTSSLDAEAQGIFLDLMFSQINKNNSTLLMVSHDQSLSNFFDRAINIHDIVIREDQ